MLDQTIHIYPRVPVELPPLKVSDLPIVGAEQARPGALRIVTVRV